MPAGVKRSNTGGNLSLGPDNDPGTANIGTPSNHAYPHPFPATITNESQSAIESTNNNDEEVMFIGRKVQNRRKNQPYFQPRHSSMLDQHMNTYQTIKVKQRQSLQQPSFNVKNLGMVPADRTRTPQDQYMVLMNDKKSGSIKLSQPIKTRTSPKKPLTSHMKGRVKHLNPLMSTE